MNRRIFLAGMVPTAALAQQERRPLPKPAKGVKVVVLKRTLMTEFQKYLKGGVMPICNAVKDGQEFLAQAPYSKCPEGMCRAAWPHMVEAVEFVHGGSVDQSVVCCTDGMRPVFFLLERIV